MYICHHNDIFFYFWTHAFRASNRRYFRNPIKSGTRRQMRNYSRTCQLFFQPPSHVCFSSTPFFPPLAAKTFIFIKIRIQSSLAAFDRVRSWQDLRVVPLQGVYAIAVRLMNIAFVIIIDKIASDTNRYRVRNMELNSNWFCDRQN